MSEEKLEAELSDNENIKNNGAVTLDENYHNHRIYLLSVIGEIEGHECLSSNTKTTNRRAACGFYGLFVYCADWDDGYPSGAYERYGHRGAADVRLF